MKRDGTILVYDVDAGHLLFEHRLSPGDRYVGFSGDCLLLSTRRSAVCLDKRSGRERWTTATFGDSSGLWPLDAGGSLLADGHPLTLSKFDGAGKRVWQLELPDESVLKLPKERTAWALIKSEDSRDAQGWARVGATWRLSPSMAVQIDGSAIRVLDISKGTTGEIRL